MGTSGRAKRPGRTTWPTRCTRRSRSGTPPTTTAGRRRWSRTPRSGGKLDHFNPEQQAQVMADFYIALKDAQDTSAYDPYIAEVRAA